MLALKRTQVRAPPERGIHSHFAASFFRLPTLLNLLFSSSSSKQERMRTSKKWWVLTVPVLLLAFWFLLREQRDRERILPDGTLLRLEQVTFGRQDDFK